MSYEGLVNKLAKLEETLSDSVERRQMDDLIMDSTGQYFYKKLGVMKTSLSKARSLMADICFTTKKLDNMEKDAKAFSRYLLQAEQCKNFIDTLSKATERGILDKTCKEFIEEVESFEPQDEILQKSTIPWSIFSATNWYLLNKWNKSKRVFSVEMAWIRYLLDSIENDITLASLDSCPYDNFGIILTVDNDKVVSVLVDYDRTSKKLYIGGFLPQDAGEGVFESSFYLELDISKTYSYALDRCKVYGMDDVNNFEVLLSPKSCYWRISDNETRTVIAPFLKHRNERGAEFVDDADCGRVVSGLIGKPRVFNYEDIEEHISNNLGTIVGGCVLMLMLYMSAENSAKTIVKREDKPVEVKSSRSKERKAKKSQKNAVEIYDVAVREVELLRKSGIITGEKHKARGISGLDMSRTVRPHMRKAHWHHYWVGRRGTPERRLILKFIMPTLVGGDESATIDNTTLGKSRS